MNTKRVNSLLVPKSGIGDVTDGYHTFNDLYHHRTMLFRVICGVFPKLAWKTLKHEDGSMYPNMFLVGISTPKGDATYHCDLDPYWNLFDVVELPRGPKFDGHTPEMALKRLQSLIDLSAISKLT